MQIQLFNDSGYVDAVNVQPADFTFVNLGTGSGHTKTIDGETYKGFGSQPNNPQFGLVTDTQKIAFYRGEGQPHKYLDNHTFYIKQNMKVVVTFKVEPFGDDSTRLTYSLRFYVGSTELTGFNDSFTQEPAPQIGLYMGVFRHNDEQTIGFYLRISNNVIRYTDVSMNYWDGSYRPKTKSKTSTVSPNGHYGTGVTTPGNMQFSDAPRSYSRINTTDHGLRVYKVTDVNVDALYERLWSKDIWQRFTNSRYSPIAGILALHKLPVDVHSTIGLTKISICGQEYEISRYKDTFHNVDVVDADNGILPVSCSSNIPGEYGDEMPVPEYQGGFLDYEPYCSAMLHLPYIGNIPIDINAVSGGSISVRYWIDIVSGNCMAHVKTTDRNGSSMIYGEYTGNCCYKYPVTGNDQGGTAVLGAAAGAATAGLVGLASGGVGAGLAANLIGGAGGIAQAELNADHHLKQAGTWPANAGTLCDPRVFLMVTRPDFLSPDNYQELVGYPAATGHVIGDFRGLTSGVMHADGISGLTDNEKARIEAAFARGVYVNVSDT